VTAPIRLLVIDDDPMQLDLMERALSRDGFDVRTLDTVTETELAAAVASSAPEIVLVDVDLPDVRPEQAVQAARDAAHGARIVLYSAWEESKLRALVKRSGADAFISKSEPVLELGPRLRRLRATPAAPR
jgi:DNA-binding response OmpR family regulator